MRGGPNDRVRFGLKSAFDYLVGEKLLNFAEAVANHGDFARELPRFVSQVRRIFTPEESELTASFDERLVTYGFGELDTLIPAYAATIHKSQGSEYPAVVIPVLTQHYPMLQRNLLYTGVTRGKRLVVLVGQKKAVVIAVRNVAGRRRWSKLGEWAAASTSILRFESYQAAWSSL